MRQREDEDEEAGWHSPGAGSQNPAHRPRMPRQHPCCRCWPPPPPPPGQPVSARPSPPQRQRTPGAAAVEEAARACHSNPGYVAALSDGRIWRWRGKQGSYLGQVWWDQQAGAAHDLLFRVQLSQRGLELSRRAGRQGRARGGGGRGGGRKQIRLPEEVYGLLVGLPADHPQFSATEGKSTAHGESAIAATTSQSCRQGHGQSAPRALRHRENPGLVRHDSGDDGRGAVRPVFRPVELPVSKHGREAVGGTGTGRGA